MMKRSPLRLSESNRRAAQRMQARLERRALTQIYLPLLLGALALVGLLLLAGVRSGAGLSAWSNLAATVLGIVLLGTGLIGIIIAVGLSFLAGMLIRVVPPYADILQGWLDVFAVRVERIAAMVSAPARWLPAQAKPCVA
jgi:hypothetical protein